MKKWLQASSPLKSVLSTAVDLTYRKCKNSPNKYLTCEKSEHYLCYTIVLLLHYCVILLCYIIELHYYLPTTYLYFLMNAVSKYEYKSYKFKLFHALPKE